MNTLSISLTTLFAAALMAIPSFGQTPATSPKTASIPSDSPKTSSAQPATATSGQPNQAEMMKQMMELSKTGGNHKLLADLVGTWTYTVKMWMNPDPNAKPDESKGTAVRKSMMDGRFFVMDVTGKMKDTTFKGMGIEGYDNVKKKFVGTWMDNMGTGVMMSEGDYDPATKTFTYASEYEAIPGMKTKIREVLKIVDNNHHTFEWYENRGGQEKKTMEINYTRKK
jgi:Protein of unknown function (DUF1579)